MMNRKRERGAAMKEVCARLAASIEEKFGKFSYSDKEIVASELCESMRKGNSEWVVEVISHEYSMSMLIHNSETLKNRSGVLKFPRGGERRSLAYQWARKFYEDNRELIAEAFLEASRP
jgi:hypothetical protein